MYIIHTDEAKEALRIEYNRRRLVVLFFLLAGLFGVLTLLVLSSYFLLQGDIASLKNQEAVLDEATKSGKTPSLETLDVLNEKMSLLGSVNSKWSAGDLIDLILGVKPEGVTIVSLLTKKLPDANTKKQAMDVTGKATTRETLLSFKQRLEAATSVESVNLPISLLAKARDIDFSMSVVFRSK